MEEFKELLEGGKKLLAEGNLYDAILNFELALEKAYLMGSDRDSIVVHEYLGKTYTKLKDPERAASHYKENLEIYEDMQDYKGLASTLNKLGMIYAASGQLEQALQYHMRCLEVCKKSGDVSGEATTLKHVGLIHQRLGNHVLALKAHTASLELKRNKGDRRGEALALFYMGQNEMDAGHFEEARKYLQEARTIFKNLGLKDELRQVDDELDLLEEMEQDMEYELEYEDKIKKFTKDDFFY